MTDAKTSASISTDTAPLATPAKEAPVAPAPTAPDQIPVTDPRLAADIALAEARRNQQRARGPQGIEALQTYIGVRNEIERRLRDEGVIAPDEDAYWDANDKHQVNLGRGKVPVADGGRQVQHEGDLMYTVLRDHKKAAIKASSELSRQAMERRMPQQTETTPIPGATVQAESQTTYGELQRA